MRIKDSNVDFSLKCKSCGKDAEDTQKFRQVSLRTWESHPDTPCTCGSNLYEGKISLVSPANDED